MIRERLRRIAAIVKADVLIRFRRSSTLVMFLLLSGLAYFFVSDPATGYALLVVDGQRRAVYNSAAIGMATALLVSIFIGMAGFYVISNAVSRDVRSRCGFVIASTTMRSGEYVVAKAAGNLVFLALFTSGFMVSSMAMLLVRNEAPLEPWVFVKQYLLIVPPALVLVAVLAIVFESVPFLSGRFGDVAYFVLYLVGLALPALMPEGSAFARYLDFGGLVFTSEQMRPLTQLMINVRFDPLKPLFVVPGFILNAEWAVARLVSLVAPLLLLVVAVRAFHRFDPAHVRNVEGRIRGGHLTRINRALKPLLCALAAFAPPAGRTSMQPALLRAAAADARITFASCPLLLAGVLALAIAAIVCPTRALRPGILTSAFFIAGLAIADVSCRERRSGTLTMIYSTPVLKSHFVWWKLIATMFVALAVTSVPLGRIALSYPASVPTVVAGVFFVASAATALGVISVTPKAFTLLFLTLFYVVLNDGGASPALNFGGFYGRAMPRVTLSYVVAASVLLLAAQGVHALRLRRES